MEKWSILGLVSDLICHSTCLPALSSRKARARVLLDERCELDIFGVLLYHRVTADYGQPEARRVLLICTTKWFRVRDTYGVEIAPGQNEIVILAVTVCIDQMSGVG
jgi:uncharacterized protein YxjI